MWKGNSFVNSTKNSYDTDIKNSVALATQRLRAAHRLGFEPAGMNLHAVFNTVLKLESNDTSGAHWSLRAYRAAMLQDILYLNFSYFNI